MIIAKKQSSDKSINQKSTMNLSISFLDILCKYVIANPSFVKISNVANLNSMLRNIDPETYRNDNEKLKRIKFIYRGIDARMGQGLKSKDMIISHILAGLDFNPDFVNLNADLTADEVDWTNRIIEEATKWSFVYRYSDKLIELCTAVKTTDFDHRTNIISELSQTVNMMGTEFRRAEMEDSLTDMTFSLTDGDFENSVTRVYETVTSPNRRLLTGMQGLNRMIGGGFEEERVYVFLGITGVGKSVTLLNLANQLRKYNTTYKPKDPTKIPCIVYLTMENTVVETVTRLFDLVTDAQYGMSSYSLQEVLNKLRQEGQLVLNSSSTVDFVIKYKANRSVDTSYCYKLYDDLLQEGKEMICLIQDHLMRIRSIYGSSEPRFELGDVINEFKTFAAQKQIPVITDFHLNRDAMKIVETYSSNKSSQLDVTQRMGKSNVSESTLILNNADVVMIINKEMDGDGREHMAFSSIKMRDKTDMFYFAQPFAYGNGIRLVEDINGPAMYKTSLKANMNINMQSNVRTSSMNSLGPISMIAKDNKSMDTSFIDNDKYNNINEEDDDLNIEDVQIKGNTVVNPFIIMPTISYSEWYNKQKENEEMLKSLREDLKNLKAI